MKNFRKYETEYLTFIKPSWVGKPAGPGIGVGAAHMVKDPVELFSFRTNDLTVHGLGEPCDRPVPMQTVRVD